MFRKNLNLNTTVFKIFIFYIAIYLFSLFLRYSNGFENLIIDIEYRFLALINIISIFLGLPISILFDITLIKFYGFKYIIIFAPILTSLGFFQIIFLRKTNFIFSKNNLLIKKINNHRIKHIFENITLIKPIFILIIRTFPILPFSLGSYLIASSSINKRFIILYSLAGAYFYYFSLFIIIQSA